MLRLCMRGFSEGKGNQVIHNNYNYILYILYTIIKIIIIHVIIIILPLDGFSKHGTAAMMYRASILLNIDTDILCGYV